MTMSLVDMARLSSLLDEALPLDFDGRKRWLDALPADLQRYRTALEASLLNGAEAQGRFDSLPQLEDDLAEGERTVGDAIGPYRLLRPLGSGGMGTVWLAERSDGAYQRQLALKLPRLELSPGLLSRWRRERDILAGLEHPRIARLYDAGVDANRQPYLALEYVDGQTIDDFIAERQPGWRERITLFLQVLEAVAHAHARGIIHRDLKPSNILVDRNGQVRLLDFGIAKLLESDESAGPTQLTELAGAALTPDFASPEQLRGERIRVSSDIYSLAVVLYGLLTGTRPYQFQGRRTQAIAESLREDEAPLASSQAGPESARRTLRGDLDAILAKALKKNPDERYESIDAFSDDLRRYLDGRPVRAQHHGWLYRTHKFSRRHRHTIARSLLLATLSVGLGYGLKLLADRAAEDGSSKDRMSIVVMPFTNQTGDPGQSYVAEGLTTSLTADLARIRDAYVVDVSTAASLSGKALSARQIGEQLGVRFVLNGSVQRSGQRLRINAQLADTRSNNQLWSETFDGDQTNLFALQDQVTGRVGNSIGREMVILAARESQKRTSNPRAADLILRAKALEVQAQGRGNLPERESLWRQVLALDPENASAMASLSVVLALQTDWRGRRDDPHSVSPKMQEGRALALKARSRDPDQPNVYYALALQAADADDYPAAVLAAEKRLSLDRNDPSAYNLLGNLTIENGEPRRAIEILNRGLELDPDRHHPLDKILLNLGHAYFLAGEYQKSIDTLLRVLQVEPILGLDHAYLAMDYLQLGQPGLAARERDEAMRLDGSLHSADFLDNLDSHPMAYRQMVRGQLMPAWRRAGLPE
jgi:serine/threonine protein kinase/tetratricopeptide (TPR) repeat protein